MVFALFNTNDPHGLSISWLCGHSNCGVFASEGRENSVERHRETSGGGGEKERGGRGEGGSRKEG